MEGAKNILCGYISIRTCDSDMLVAVGVQAPPEQRLHVSVRGVRGNHDVLAVVGLGDGDVGLHSAVLLQALRVGQHLGSPVHVGRAQSAGNTGIVRLA
jgi:hypothetical protein